MYEGWLKVKSAASYADVSKRTMETWIREGLRCAQMPSGLRLIKAEWLDEFLEGFEAHSDVIDKITGEVMNELG